MVAMNTWGNDGHGPGGDPSWLGGNDRGGGLPGRGDGAPEGEARSGGSGFSSDFSSDFGGGGPRPTSDFDTSADEMGPEFGTRAERPAPRDERPDGPEWKSEFMQQSGLSRKKGSRSILQMLIGLAVPVIFMIIFFTVFSRHGFGFPWFVLLFMLFPLIGRFARMFRDSNRD